MNHRFEVFGFDAVIDGVSAGVEEESPTAATIWTLESGQRLSEVCIMKH